MLRSGACGGGQFERVELDASIDAAHRGSNSTLGQLLEAYRDYLLTLATEALDANVQPKMATSDLVQESLLQAVRDYPGFQGSQEPELRAWLKQILLNNVLDAHRRFQKTSKRNVAHEIPTGQLTSSGAGLMPALTVDFRPLSELAAREERAIVEESIASLDGDYRQVIELRSLQGLPFDEVGRLMNRSGEAARKLWSRAVQKLSRQLGQKSTHGRTVAG